MLEKELFIGAKILSVEGLKVGSRRIVFKTSNGVFLMYHDQDCCEDVRVDDVVGKADLVGAVVLDLIEKISKECVNTSCTWTFYTLKTNKGYTDIKWYGESNGYYSESVDFVEVSPRALELI